MTVKQAIYMLGGAPKSELEAWISKRVKKHEQSEAVIHELRLLSDRFFLDGVLAGVEAGDSPSYKPYFPLDAVLVSPEYLEVTLHKFKGTYAERYIAGRPQSHLAEVDVYRPDHGWLLMPGKMVVIVD